MDKFLVKKWKLSYNEKKQEDKTNGNNRNRGS